MSDQVSSRVAAALWRRLAARMVDLVTVFFVLWALALMSAGAVIDDASEARVAFVLLFAVYEVAFVAAHGQTPGKDLLRVKVARTGTAETPALGQALRRWPLPVLLVLVPHPLLATAAVLATGATAMLRVDRNAVHDLLSQTWVVEYHADEEEQLEPADTQALDQLRRRHGIFHRVFDRVPAEGTDR